MYCSVNSLMCSYTVFKVDHAFYDILIAARMLVRTQESSCDECLRIARDGNLTIS